MKMSKLFHDVLWDYSASVVSVVGRHISGREDWMGPREDDYEKCEQALAKLEKLWTYEKDDLETLKAIHATFLGHYRQGRPEEGQKLLKEIDELIYTLRGKWKKS